MQPISDHEIKSTFDIIAELTKDLPSMKQHVWEGAAPVALPQEILITRITNSLPHEEGVVYYARME
jgi:hypothetical protein